jgi:environmental stress-induced protein Ves
MNKPRDLDGTAARRAATVSSPSASPPGYTSDVPRIVSPAEFRSQPWKNGGGVTHEIVRWPDTEDYEIRISLADDRAAGPFSRFPGYRRWSFLAGGAPIVLDIAGAERQLVALGDRVEVDGDVAIHCALPAGPTQLLNILVRDGIAAEVGTGPCPRPIRFAFALAAMPWLAAGHAALFDPPQPATLARHAVWLR